jgi:surface carbohydrate biosynthesis protein
VKTFLLQVDQKARDLVSVLLIGEYLEDLGQSVFYCSKTDMHAMALKIRPDVFVMSSSQGEYRDLANAIAPFCKIVLMTQEGACATKESTLVRHLLKGCDEACYIKGLSRVYLWGELSKQWLLEENVYPEDIIRVVGTSRLDLYHLGATSKSKSDKLKVGFANRGFPVNHKEQKNPVMEIDSCRGTGGFRAYLDKDREWEDWIWHSVASLRVNLELVEQLSKDKETEIRFRPDPYERYQSYKFLEDKYSNFKINVDPTLYNFMAEIDVLITEFSTTGLEAMLLKKPVIATQKLLGPRLADHNSKANHLNPDHMQFYWQPNTYSELLELIEKIKDKQLPYSPEPEKAKRYLKEIYNWKDQEVSSSFKIAVDLISLAKTESTDTLKSLHQKEFKEHPSVQQLSRKLRIPVVLAKTLASRPSLFLARDLVRSIRNKEFAEKSRTEYYPWNLSERRTVQKYFAKLKRYDEASLNLKKDDLQTNSPPAF